MKQNQFDSIDLSDNGILLLEGFPKLRRVKTLLLNNNRVMRIGRHLEGAEAPRLFLWGGLRVLWGALALEERLSWWGIYVEFRRFFIIGFTICMRRGLGVPPCVQRFFMSGARALNSVREEEEEIYICSSRLGLIKMVHRHCGSIRNSQRLSCPAECPSGITIRHLTTKL
jgi:hypothetical protein